MTRVFDSNGNHVAVNIVKALSCRVSQVKTTAKDGYSAVQITAFAPKGKGEKSLKIAEFKDQTDLKEGETVSVKEFTPGELVTVTGTGKGKGFAGTIKRHGFSRGPESHGSNNVREPGSIGGGYPQRVVKGRRMPGRMGNETVTVKNLKLVDVEDDILLISGSLPGPRKSIVKIFSLAPVKKEENKEE